MGQKEKFNGRINLMEDSITDKEISAINDCLRSGKYTQGALVDEFERKFAEWNGSKYAVFVNSGSSANLLMVAYLKEKFNLKESDEILVPNVTWPTTIFPVIQNGFTPVFCDVDESFNISLDSIKKMINEKTKAIFVVHLLGQPAKINEIKKICEERNLILIEDCCESTGAKENGIKVGNFGIMGSFSFYFGHHMTTIEGGMITTNDFHIYDFLKSLRSHGWVKETERENDYPYFKNKSFLFDVPGYNLRNTNINAAVGLVQLEKLNGFIERRLENHKYFLEKIKNIRVLTQKVNFNETSSFSLALIFENEQIRDYVSENLGKRGIESRPIVAGNLLKQPVFINLNPKKDSEDIANKIHNQGIYLPNNQFINKEKVNYMVETVEELLNEAKLNSKNFSFNNDLNDTNSFKSSLDSKNMSINSKILVTGSRGMVGGSLVRKLKEKEYNNLLLPSSSELDLRNQKAVQDYFKDNKPEYIFHIAAKVGGIGANINSPSDFLTDNLLMQSNVISSARDNDVKKLLFLGSSCIYPRECPQPMKEEHLLSGKLEPTNEGYAISKVCGLKECEFSNKQYGTNFISLMPPNLYGLNDHFEPEKSHVVSALITKFHNAKNQNLEFVDVWGTGTPRREFLYVDDCADAMIYFMQKYSAKEIGPFLNIGSGKDISIKDLAHLIKEVVGYSGELKFDTSKPDGMPKKLLDSSKAQEMGWEAKTELREGLGKTYQWYLENN